jgi:hypothetical protein
MRASKAKILRYDAREGKAVNLKADKNDRDNYKLYKRLKKRYGKGVALPESFKLNYLEFKLKND